MSKEQITIPESVAFTVYNYAAFEAIGEGLPHVVIIQLTGEQKAELRAQMNIGEGLAACHVVYPKSPSHV